ncbi:hypothetical protein ACLQ3C_07720 [Gordonia sp. DT30]|uniref:hypothetical protein n=1 Tax=unclassified Gordonia (in: high G+C Gram-positive bacteria) TaxID=2657482 RepID=UPI003CF4BD89
MTTTATSRSGEYYMNELLADICSRAETTPSLPAVRFGGRMVTYGALGAAIDSYEPVLRRHGMSHEAAFYAAILHSIPALADITDPDEQGRNLDQIVTWLARHLPPSANHLQVAG